jgi:hypothetical protein
VIWVCPKMRIYPTFLSPLWQGPLCHFCGDKVCPFWRNPVSCREGHQFCGSLGTTLIHPQTKPDGKLNWGCPCWRAESIRPSSNSNSSKEQWLVAKVLVFKRMLIGVPSSCWTQFVCFLSISTHVLVCQPLLDFFFGESTFCRSSPHAIVDYIPVS